ncbi:MAG: methyltransferase domain-containing protein [Acidobacteriota bacterium]
MSANGTSSANVLEEVPRHRHVCPWWIGYLIANPLRKLAEDPETILAPFAGPGMTAVDIGAAFGFFSLPLARMIGAGGRVICVDVQPRMLSSLSRRARRRHVDHIIRTHLASQESFGLAHLEGQADLVLAIHVVHETAYPRRFLTQCRDLLRSGGTFLLAEPSWHVSNEEFESTRRLAREVGFAEREFRRLRRSRLLVLEKPRA